MITDLTDREMALLVVVKWMILNEISTIMERTEDSMLYYRNKPQAKSDALEYYALNRHVEEIKNVAKRECENFECYTMETQDLLLGHRNAPSSMKYEFEDRVNRSLSD